MKIGFDYYDTLVSTQPTTQEILASLTGAQKLAILNGFAAKKTPHELKYQLHIAPSVTRYLYGKVGEVADKCKELMTSGTPPASKTALRTAVAALFADDFTTSQVGAIINKMIAFSKHDGTGDWTFYSTEVSKTVGRTISGVTAIK